MADSSNETATFTFDFKSNATSVANSSATALAQLKTQIQGDEAALGQMQKAFANLNKGAVVNIAQAQALRKQIVAQKQAVSDNQAKFLALGGTFGKVQHATGDLRSRFKQLADEALAAKGPLGSMAGGLGGLASLGPAAAIVATVAAVVALTVAIAAAGAALAKYGIEVADARRSELLHLEALTKIRYWYAGFGGTLGNAAEKATFLQSQIDAVSSTVALGRDEIAGYASQLYKMGLRGGNLQQALQGVAITAATQGDQQAQIFAGWAAGANMTGQSVKRLADDVKGRLGGIARAQLISLTAQSTKLHESFAMLFSGLKIDKILEGLHLITDAFSQQQAIGQALKSMFDAIFNPLGDSAAGAALVVKRLMQGFILAAQDVVIAYLELRNQFRGGMFGKFLKELSDTATAVNIGKTAFYGLAAAVGLTAIFGGLLAITIGLIVVGILALPIAFALAIVGIGMAIKWCVEQFVWLWQQIKHGFEDISHIDWAAAGRNIAHGIAAGIGAGAEWVRHAIGSLAESALHTFEEILQIQSPSRRFRKRAFEIPRGASLGIDDGSPYVDRAIARMTPDTLEMPAATPRGAASPSSAQQGRGELQPLIGHLEIHTMAKDTDGVKDAAEEGLIRALTRVGIHVGAPRALGAY